MAFLRIIVDSPFTANGLASVVNLAPGRLPALNNIINYFGGVSGGNYMAALRCAMGAVQATGAVTMTGLPSADETVTIGNVVFTAKASGATGNQFNIGASATITAANLAAAINASTTMAGRITATSAAGVVTLTVSVPGLIGNSVQLSETLSNATITAFAGGSNGTNYTLDFL